MPNGRQANEVLRSLTNQAPVNDMIIDRMETLRTPAKNLAIDILNIVPDGREKSIALTKLEEAIMWAIKGIALNQGEVK